MLARVLSSALIATITVVGSQAHSQANVSENEAAVLYVDAQSGSDSNSGSSSSPLKTIQAAVNKANSNNQKSVGTKIVVNAGVYRETVNIDPVSGLTAAPLTLEAASNGAAIISASEVLSGWSADPRSSGAFVTNWTPTQSTCPLPSGWPAVQRIALHTEMAFVNGIPMTQVLANSDLKPSTFFVNTSDGTLHLFPPTGVDPSSALVEVASRAKTISVVGRTNIVLRGLVFQHAASCINTSGATVSSSANVLIDSIQATWNNFGGLGIFSSSNVTVQNSVGSYNGGVGFQGNKDQTTLFTNNETDYNNWRGAQAAFYNWAQGGTKLFQMRTTTVQNHASYNNQAQGLWFDTDNQKITINNATLIGSYNAALQLERNKGPVLLENSHLCSSGVGVNLLTTEGLTVNNNVFFNNGATNKYQAQFYLAGSAGGINITDWQTGQASNLITTGTVMSGNSFIDGGTGQLVFGTYLSGSDWTDFTSTLHSNNNTWFDPNTATAFRIVNGKNVNLAGWQTATGADYSSAWAEPAAASSTACSAPPATYSDFNVSIDNGGYTMSSGRATAAVRVNSFNFGAVNLSVSGLPAGVTASFSAPSLISGASTLTFTASSTSASQTVPVTLWAISGDRVHNITFNLSVTSNSGVTSTSTSLAASASSISQGSPVTLTATVKPASGSTAPTGSVTFYNGQTSLGTATLSGGVATLTTSALPAGTNSLTASYAGASAFSASSSSAVDVMVNSSTASTTTTLAASATSVTQTSPVTLTATVKASTASAIPSGTVTFYNGTVSIGSVSLSGGVAALTTSSLPAGTDSISAIYSGTDTLASSTSNAVSIMVNPVVVSTTTALAASSTALTQGSAVTFTATVTQASGTTAPTGTVSFYNGSVLVGSAPLAAGLATLSTSALPAGTDSVSAAYSGAVSFKASSSGIVVITIKAASSTAISTITTLSSSSSSISQNSPVTFVARVKQAAGTATPTGAVTFLSGGVTVGTAQLASGTASFSTSSLPAGTASITAAFAGTSTFKPSTSPAVSITVQPAAVATATSLSTSAASAIVNSSLTLTAHVKAASGTTTPTGTITFFNGTAAIGTASLTSGSASITTSNLPEGHQSLSAAYNGSSSFLKSTSNAVSITIASPPTTATVGTITKVVSSTSQADQGFTICLTATVTASAGTTVPTGEVAFIIGSRKIGSAALAGGKAYLTTSALPVGSDAILASYEGNGTFSPSSSTSVIVKIAGPDFTVKATPSEVSVTPGENVDVALLITPQNGFSQEPQLSCAGLPDGATCSFTAPARKSDGTSIVNMTIHTASNQAETNTSRTPRSPFALALLPLLLCISPKSRRQFRRFASLSLLFVAIVLLGGSTIGCGGRPASAAKTSAAPSTVQITVTAQTSVGLKHSTNVQLTLM